VTSQFAQAPFIGLIDDDGHSARLFMRVLAANDGPSVRHYSDDEEAVEDLAQVLSDPQSHWPELLVVDLKGHSQANLEFICRHQAWLHQKGVALLVMVPPTNRAGRMVYLEAGATAVFFRQSEADAYRHELAGIANFWARTERLDAVGM
jgi:DNA-binding response OmpR family regulator